MLHRRQEHCRRHPGMVVAAMATGNRTNRSGRAAVLSTIRHHIRRETEGRACQVYGTRRQSPVLTNLCRDGEEDGIVTSGARVFIPDRHVGALPHAGWTRPPRLGQGHADGSNVARRQPIDGFHDVPIVVPPAADAAILPEGVRGGTGIRVGQCGSQN